MTARYMTAGYMSQREGVPPPYTIAARVSPAPHTPRRSLTRRQASLFRAPTARTENLLRDDFRHRQALAEIRLDALDGV